MSSVSLREFTEKIGSGSTPKGGESSYVASGIPFIRSQNVQSGSLVLDTVAFIEPETHEKMRGTKLKPNDVLLNLTGASIGRSAMVPVNFLEGNVNQHVCIIRLDRARYHPKFLCEFLNSARGQYLIDSAQSGGSRQGLNFQEVGDLAIPDVDIEKQARIVEILSDADAAIATTEASFTIRNKRLRGLIQSLIGVHQESDEWNPITLEDIGTVSSAGVDKKSVNGETPVTLLNYMDVYRMERFTSGDLSQRVTAPSPKVTSCNIQQGDIFFTPTSEKRDDIAHSAVAVERILGAVYSYHLVRLRPSICLDINFSSYAFQTNHFMRQAYRLADGSGQRYVIALGGFRGMTIRLPCIDQQQSIGACLAEARSELDQISLEIAALKKQKRGLMQKLLTGKLRAQGN